MDDVDEVITIVDEVDNGDGTVTLVIDIDDKFCEKLQQIADKKGITIEKLIEDAIVEYARSCDENK